VVGQFGAGIQRWSRCPGELEREIITKKLLKAFPLIAALLLLGCDAENATESSEAKSELSADEARAIAKEAFIYGFPMVVNYKTMYQYSVDAASPDYKSDFNVLSCEARVFTPADRSVVTPNADTPYCMFWGDIRSDPLVLRVPEIEPERFFQVQLVDLYTHNFAYVSTVATGNVPGTYLIAGPDWDGDTPEGIIDVIRSEMPFVFAVIRTQLFSPDDIVRVKEIQDGFDFQPLSAFLSESAPAALPAIDFPEWREGAQFDVGFFDFFDFMLSLIEPVADEQVLFERFAKIGLGTEAQFDIDNYPSKIADALAAGIQDGFKELEATIAAFGSDPLGSSKIFGTREFLQDSAQRHFGWDDLYLLRMIAAHTGLYGNSGAEAVYPTYLVDSDGARLDGSQNNFQITFAGDQLPPVKAFWSLTMYDGRTQLFIDNSLDRYLLNSTMLEQFVRGEDDSLTLYIQKESPGDEMENNWLPAPDGPFYMVLRLYGPEAVALEGEWLPPPAIRRD